MLTSAAPVGAGYLVLPFSPGVRFARPGLHSFARYAGCCWSSRLSCSIRRR